MEDALKLEGNHEKHVVLEGKNGKKEILATLVYEHTVRESAKRYVHKFYVTHKGALVLSLETWGLKYFQKAELYVSHEGPERFRPHVKREQVLIDFAEKIRLPLKEDIEFWDI